MGSKSKQKPKKGPTQVSYKQEPTRRAPGGGQKRRPVGLQYTQSRKATPIGKGFGGTKTTLG